MQFTDPVYLFLLLPLACTLFYWTTPRFGKSAGFSLLLLLSLLFYWTWGTGYLLLLCLSFTINFVAACVILVAPDGRVALRRTALYAGQLYNFGALIWFKYRFIVYIFSRSGSSYSLLDAAIPAGISFYTFQQAVLLVDAYHRDPSVVAYLGDMRTVWGKLRGYVRHSFFVSFFAHLLIGPIVYLKEFQPQIASPDFGKAKRSNLEAGAALVLIGLFKKIFIADHLAPIADGVFGIPGHILLHMHIPATAAWLAALAYYAQLYFDFSGYSDLAIGSARMLGIRFPINFFSPLKAVGIVDFYRRWHITLTRVIARFVYAPLSLAGTRVAVGSAWAPIPLKLTSIWLPLVINFEVIALWHGMRLTFLIFGVIHGLWYVVETEVRSSRRFKEWRRNTPERIRSLLGRGWFLCMMTLTFALFRSATVPGYWHVLKSMFSLDIATPNVRGVIEVLGALLVIWFLPNSMQLLARYRAGITTYPNKDYTPPLLRLRWRPDGAWTLLMTGMLVVCLYYMSRQPPFLYIGF
jgi:D-alanyl-lipoteichoic acid acyltransferase DltB (MBOAT superfamily)